MRTLFKVVLPSFALALVAVGIYFGLSSRRQNLSVEVYQQKELANGEAEVGNEKTENDKTRADLRIEILKRGKGEKIASGQTAVVHYTGWLENGAKFDSSLDRGEPFSFVLGAGDVIAGWDIGVEGMRVGEKRKLIIPPELAYGKRGVGRVIPPDAVLIFEIELLAIK